ncbi:MAG: hypothetical protein ETSY1_36870 [Candidatus Entotheonella factor]|uniref:SCP domain-containing protein n=1 Tax=Entotheonella factor TaxID=1429438 RepID=W4L7G5_ENTF1|nr:MAG: hypothetical protein ETSY1_36870 [Candidatus Entotheonella factor]
MQRHLYSLLAVLCGFVVMISLGVAGDTEYVIQAKNTPRSEHREPRGFEGSVAAHNVWRQAVGVPNVAWSSTLAATAQEWADYLASTQGKCRMQHRPRRGKQARPFGENLYQAFSSPNPPQTSPQDVVKAWGDEIENYDANTHTCAPGAVCGHYTQVVWRGTQFVGCGKATCQTKGYHSIIWVCNYDPPGNFVGQSPF